MFNVLNLFTSLSRTVFNFLHFEAMDVLNTHLFVTFIDKKQLVIQPKWVGGRALTS